MRVIRTHVALLGNAHSGKSALAAQLLGPAPQSTQYSMNGFPKLWVKRIRVPETTHWVELYVHDCPGSPAFIELAKAAIAECSYAVLVFDRREADALTTLDEWLTVFREAALTSHPRGVVVAFGPDDTVITDEEAENWSRQRGLLYVRAGTAEGDPFALVAAAEYKRTDGQ